MHLKVRRGKKELKLRQNIVISTEVGKKEKPQKMVGSACSAEANDGPLGMGG